MIQRTIPMVGDNQNSRINNVSRRTFSSQYSKRRPYKNNNNNNSYASTNQTEKSKQYLQRIKAAGSCQDCLAILDEMENRSSSTDIPQPNAHHYHGAIHACGRDGGQWKTALHLLEKAKRQQQQRESDDDTKLATNEAKVVVRCYNSAIVACGRSGRVDEALKLLEEMKHSQKYSPDVVSYSSVISACAKQGATKWETALQLLREMSLKGRRLKPNVVTYTSAISACERAGQTEVALQLLQEMMSEQVGLAPNVVTYGAAISACGDNFRKALQLLREEMPARGVQPNPITYNAAMGACEKAGQWEQALKLLLEEMPPIAPTATSFTICIGACGKAGQWKRALELLHNEMPRHGLAPNIVVYNAAVGACERSGRWKEALKLLEEIPSPDVTTFNAALSACAKAEDPSSKWEVALELLEQLKSHSKLRPDVISYNAAISACEKAGQWQLAVQLLREMTTTPSMTTTASSQDQGTDVAHASSNGGIEQNVTMIEPDVVSYSAAISACENGGQWKMALELLREMTGKNIAPDVIVYSAAISACEKGNQWQTALELLEEMEQKFGILPNVITFRAAMTACFRSGRYREALEVWREARMKGHFANAAGENDTKRLDLHNQNLAVSFICIVDTLLTTGNSWKQQNTLEAQNEPLSCSSSSSSSSSRQQQQRKQLQNIVVVTGKGLGSGPVGPVLQTQVPQFLSEKGGPKLVQDDTNKGRFVISDQSLQEWIDSGQFDTFVRTVLKN